MIPFTYNLRSMLVRKGTTVATAFGVGLVVFVLAAALMLAAGVNRTFARAGHPDRVVVLRKGADSELASSLDLDTVRRVRAIPGIKADRLGAPIFTGEAVLVLTLTKSGGERTVSNVAIRGISANSSSVRPEVRIVAGRVPVAGTNEVMLGRGLVGRFEGLTLGGRLEFKRNHPASIVGVFEAAGSSFESEVWADVDVVRSAFGRENTVSAITAQLESPAAWNPFRSAIEHEKGIGVEALREEEYYARQSSNTSTFVRAIGLLIAIFLSAGATIGGAITMHTAVAQRRREIGTLRALGFSRRSVLGSFLLEGIVLSLAGGAIGVLGAIAMSLVKVSMMNFATWQEVTFEFVLEPSILLVAVAGGTLIGVLGGFVPAMRAASISPIEGLRA